MTNWFKRTKLSTKSTLVWYQYEWTRILGEFWRGLDDGLVRYKLKHHDRAFCNAPLPCTQYSSPPFYSIIQGAQKFLVLFHWRTLMIEIRIQFPSIRIFTGFSGRNQVLNTQSQTCLYSSLQRRREATNQSLPSAEKWELFITFENTLFKCIFGFINWVDIIYWPP